MSWSEILATATIEKRENRLGTSPRVVKRIPRRPGLISCHYKALTNLKAKEAMFETFLKKSPIRNGLQILPDDLDKRTFPARDSSSITGLALDKSFPQSLYYHGVIHKRPRDRQHGDNNLDPPATAQLQHAIIWKPYGLVPFFRHSTPKACLGVRRTSLTTTQNPRRNRMRSQRNSIL